MATVINITAPPAHGTVSISGTVMTYTPNTGYNGPDTYEYEMVVDGVSQGTRNVCLTVSYVEGPKEWRPIDDSCVIVSGVQTGYKEWATLEEFDSFNGVPTGVTKPNVPGDPNYVAPVYAPTECLPQEAKYMFSTSSLSPTFTFNMASSLGISVQARRGSTIISSTGPSTSSAKQLNLSGHGPGITDIYVVYPQGQINTIKQVVVNDRQVTAVSLNEFVGLTQVEFRDGSISSVNVSALTDLVVAAFSGNNLSSFGPYTLPNLEILELFNNNLSVINTAGYPKLRRAAYQGNSLGNSGFNFSSNPDLEDVWLAANTAITVYDAAITPGLKSLTLDQTGIASLPLSLMPGLISCDCTKCVNLTTLSISANNNITDLRCGETPFTDDTADPAIVDAIIIKMDQNITSGGFLHYDAIPPQGVQPSSASLAAYNSLVAKGCNLQGKVPA